ncbi:zf-HC2 domain-containing protein [Nocardia terpenica]|uniref:zf-HC2 domain-containing protein n=1 Tax=Nocardia terpenica TaxID=455432 RepID=UPI001893BD25|nr:zf-HC2 domain-containing protein [Nocardia terpenica]MBF6059406.1 zf-HC2 domain-containing protein [Nocardia terpenica]MBF6103055.1 zf-HC2 domain-containing protein [Nocardia terpenica]MBF6110756.1 zf-HC2 domain-containing protein [Nocardia terpenica]MBF6116887.1 zf-HC2 domain-containing protein [Nocardia terpenica]MBF6151275.1 zf-HC2 domain-containing protein [Nocardia terpenica]
MNCDVCREALSARIDGEPEPVPAAHVDRHVDACGDCADWYARSTRAVRALRLRPAEPVPDLTAAIVDHTDRRPVRPRPVVSPLPRAMLAGIGIAQCGLAVGTHGTHGPLPLCETLAWNLALGLAMLGGAIRPRLVTGVIAVVTAAVAVSAAVLATDVVRHELPVHRVGAHAVLLAALATLLVLRHRAAAPPAAADTAVVLPPGARPGRRTDHLTAVRDSAA